MAGTFFPLAARLHAHHQGGVRFEVLPATLLRIAVTATVVLPTFAETPIEASAIAEPTRPVVSVDLPTALATFDVVWSTVDSRHFDADHGGVDWEAVRAELRPQALVEDRAELRAVLREMLDRLDQSHFELIPQEDLPESRSADISDEVAGGIGLDLRAIDGELVVTRVDSDSPAERVGIQTGWILSSIGGKTSIGLFERSADPDPRETAFRVWKKSLRATYGPIGSEVDATFIDGSGNLSSFRLERVARDVVPYVSHDLPTFYLSFASGIVEHAGQRIGWVRFSNWFEPTAERFDAAMEEFADCDGIVIDLRGNTGGAGHLIGRVAGHFFDDNVVLGQQRMRVGSFAYKTRPAARTFDGALALVVDSATSSSSEVFAGGMQALGRAHVIGETTAGAVLPATTRLLPNGDALLYAIADFVTADGTILEGRGVETDAAVTLRRADLLAGDDAPFRHALEWIDAECAMNRPELALSGTRASAR